VFKTPHTQAFIEIDNRLGLAETVSFAFVQLVNVRDVVGVQGRHNLLGMFGRHHFVIRALEDRHRVLDLVGMENRRPGFVAFGGFRQFTHQRVVVAFLEFVRADAEIEQVCHAKQVDARLEHAGETDQRVQHCISAGRTAHNHHPQPPRHWMKFVRLSESG
jgi:hypothetical protein